MSPAVLPPSRLPMANTPTVLSKPAPTETSRPSSSGSPPKIMRTTASTQYCNGCLPSKSEMNHCP